MDRAEERFEWLLKQRGYRFWREDELGKVIQVRRKRPDYFVKTPRALELLVEVESFEKITPLRKSPSQAMARSSEPVRQRIRTAVIHADQQLRPYRDLGVPMLVALDNWRRVGIPSNIEDLWDALFYPRAGRPLLNPKDKRHISAVAWNLPRWRGINDRMTKEHAMYVRIIHNPLATVPLLRSVFNGKCDRHYRIAAKGRLAEF